MYYRLMIYGIAILSASFITVWADCDQRCQTIGASADLTSNARPLETAVVIARCYSICAVAQV